MYDHLTPQSWATWNMAAPVLPGHLRQLRRKSARTLSPGLRMPQLTPLSPRQGTNPKQLTYRTTYSALPSIRPIRSSIHLTSVSSPLLSLPQPSLQHGQSLGTAAGSPPGCPRGCAAAAARQPARRGGTARSSPRRGFQMKPKVPTQARPSRAGMSKRARGTSCGQLTRRHYPLRHPRRWSGVSTTTGGWPRWRSSRPGTAAARSGTGRLRSDASVRGVGPARAAAPEGLTRWSNSE